MLYEYKLFVLKKASPPRHLHERHFHLNHACLGLATEYLELILSTSRENTEEELGDFMWYTILAGHAVEYDLSTLPTEFNSKERPTLTIRNLAEILEAFVSLAKKQIVYGNDQSALLHKCFYGLWTAFGYHLQACDYPMPLCIAENTDKLNKRYSTTFSQEEAAERKDKAE